MLFSRPWHYRVAFGFSLFAVSIWLLGFIYSAFDGDVGTAVACLVGSVVMLALPALAIRGLNQAELIDDYVTQALNYCPKLLDLTDESYYDLDEFTCVTVEPADAADYDYQVEVIQLEYDQTLPTPHLMRQIEQTYQLRYHDVRVPKQQLIITSADGDSSDEVRSDNAYSDEQGLLRKVWVFITTFNSRFYATPKDMEHLCKLLLDCHYV